MTAAPTTRWLPSSKRNPCPICGRSKDGDCRTSGDGLQVICHRGSSLGPPQGLKPSREPIKGKDGQDWAFTHDNDRGAHFKLHQPLDGAAAPRAARKVVPFRQPAAPAAVTGPIELAAMPAPWPAEPPAHLPDRYRIDYGPGQWTEWADRTGKDGAHQRGERPRHLRDNFTNYTAGPDPWPLFGSDLMPAAAGKWIAAAEGPKCALWLQAGGVVAVSQPGHDHKSESITRRFRELKAAGVAGMVYLADNDATGQRKAQQLQECAAEAGLPLQVLNAVDLWPDVHAGGSIDDAPGTAAERVAVVVAALAESTAAAAEPHLREPQSDREPTLAERITEAVEALLQATLADAQSEIDASYSELYRLGVSRERSQERMLMLWAERKGYNLSPGGGPTITRGRMFGKAKEAAGLRQQLPGFLLDRDLHLVVATASGGKTTACAELATVMSARDRGFLDHEAPRADGAEDKRDTVLVIASDGEATAYAMWESYLEDLAADKRGAKIEIWAQDNDTGEQAWNVSLRNLERLVRRLEEGDVCLVVMDTANAVLRGAGVNTGVGPIEAYLRLLKQIVCRHCALLMAHHTNRSGTPDLKGIGGHPAFQEVPSVIHLIEQKRQADGNVLYLWHVLKLRGSSYRRFAYERREGQLVVTEGHLFENCDQQVLVALHTQLLLKAGTAPGELIRVTKRPPQSVYNALDRLRGAKLLRRQGNGYRLTPSGRAAVEAMRV